MIPSSGLYRIPRADAASRSAEAIRYARSEYGTSSISWMLRARPASPGLMSRFAARLTAVFGGLRAHPARAGHSAPLRTGIAAAHFAGEPARAHAALSRPHSHPVWDVRPIGGLVLPTLEADTSPDVCECQP